MSAHRGFALILVACTVLSGTRRTAADQPAVTVYNQDFGVVRERVRLELKSGVTEIRFPDIAAHVEPDSVILRDPAGRRRIAILEQNYRSDPLTQELLLSIFEGQEIEFLVAPDKPTARGRIVRSGYVPHAGAWRRYGPNYYQVQAAYGYSGAGQPIIEMNGTLRFGLPGTPLFPSLADDTVLKPTLHWRIETDSDGPLDAELSYVTGGMSWKADYNVLSPQTGDALDLVGWVTIDNQCGRTFESAQVKLMAGDVSKVAPEMLGRFSARELGYANYPASGGAPVVEKAFDEYHLYTLQRPTTLRDREIKQVEFIRASGVPSQRLYVYDGAALDDARFSGWSPEDRRNNPDYGTRCNRKVWVMCEFQNTREAGLGMPLPAGRMRFYRTDDDGRLEFTGENEIDHTPQGEPVRVYTGNAFDLVGERVRTNFEIDHNERWLVESFELRLRNRKSEPAQVRAVERLYRWSTWRITEKSLDFSKKDSQTIEFLVDLPPDGERVVTYTVRYSW